jgi:mono/diheme cytochrome c family protein
MKHAVQLPLLACLLGLGVAGPLGAQESPALSASAASSDSTVADAAPTAVAQAPDALKGKRAFQRYCAVCHGARGEGGLGPSLQGARARLGDEAIRHQLREPRATMPKLSPQPVDDRALDDLLAYFSHLK